ncbi:PQQ-binding-like beta-propeller repeat protein [Sphingomonas sp.]|uniref:YncE family protein n=1 Tax=Sphingomonas sp. TaxID=28214 RepID=UPI0031D4B23D
MRRLILAAALLATAALPATARELLLVGNKGEDTLGIYDLADGKQLARIPTGAQPHEIAVMGDGTQAAVVSYGGTTIDIVDLDPLGKIATIELAPNKRPHGLLWMPKSERLIATTEGSSSVAIVEPDGKITSIATGQQGSHMVALLGEERGFVANIGSGTVSVVDLVKNTKLRDLAVGGKPEGVAVAGGKVFVGDLSAPRLTVLDAGTYEKLAELAIDGNAIRVIASPDGKTVATSNVDKGSVTLIDVATHSVLRSFPVSGEPQAAQVTLVWSADGKRLYAAETMRNQIAEIDAETGKVLRRIDVGKNGDGLAVTTVP